MKESFFSTCISKDVKDVKECYWKVEDAAELTIIDPSEDATAIHLGSWILYHYSGWSSGHRIDSYQKIFIFDNPLKLMVVNCL